MYAVNADQKEKAKQSTKLALRLAMFCGFKADEIVNLEYAKVVTGVSSVSEIGSAPKKDELVAMIQQLVKLNTSN